MLELTTEGAWGFTRPYRSAGCSFHVLLNPVPLLSDLFVGNTLRRTQDRTEGRSWARKATLNYAGRNWDARKGKFEIWIEGYKERDPAWNKGRDRTLGIAFKTIAI